MRNLIRKMVKNIIVSLPYLAQAFLSNVRTSIKLLFDKGISPNVSNQSPIPKVTVICLIYKSTGYADFVYKSFIKHTKDAEFLFVANDATEKVKEYLKSNNLPHVIFDNEDPTEHYLKRVYRAYNYGVSIARGDVVVLVNSDMAFSDGWLDSLVKNLDRNRIVCSRFVESGKLLGGRLAIVKNFGMSYKDFNDEAFQNYIKNKRRPELHYGGQFMPCAIYKDVFMQSGGYPIGNRKEDDGTETPGDIIYFYEVLKPMGIIQYTDFNSIIYHIQEGELDE